MAELRSGGLALVIKGEDCGKCVSTDRYIPVGSTFESPCGKVFIADFSAGAWLCTGEIHVRERPDLKGWAVYWTESLLPIDGDNFSHEGERKKELTHG